MRQQIGKWLTAIGQRLTGTTPTELIDQKTAKQLKVKQLIMETSSMSFDEAQYIVMHFSELLHLNAITVKHVTPADYKAQWEAMPLRKVRDVRKEVDGNTQIEQGLFYSRQILPYSKRNAIRAFKVYFVNVLNSAAADNALETLFTRVIKILPDDMEEPTFFDDTQAHIALVEDLYDCLAAEQSTLEIIRKVRHGIV